MKNINQEKRKKKTHLLIICVVEFMVENPENEKTTNSKVPIEVRAARNKLVRQTPHKFDMEMSYSFAELSEKELSRDSSDLVPPFLPTTLQNQPTNEIKREKDFH